MEEKIVILTKEERDSVLSKKGFKYKKVFSYCENCGEEFSVKLVKLSESWLCRKCKISETKKNVSEEEKMLIQEKRKASTLKKYGVDNVFKSEEIKEKSKETLQKNFGVSNARQLQLKKDYVKKQQVKIERSFSEDFLDKHFKELNENVKTRWDERTSEDLQKILEKRKQTNQKKYGKDFAQQSDSVKQKYKENSLKKWGVENPQQNRSVRLKVEKTFKEKYGSNHPNFCFEYENQTFDSSWELAVWIWAKDKGFEIEREPEKIEYLFEGKTHTYYPDFKINGKLIEVKGPQFFTKDGKMINPFDHSLDNLFEAKHLAALEKGVSFYKKEEMRPILEYIEKTYTADYLNLFRKNLEFPFPQLTTKKDFDLIRYFHKSLYKACRGKNKSPYEAWYDKNLVKKSALNRLKYKGSCKSSDIIQGFNVAKIAPKVSVFKPALAEELIKKYLKDVDVIFDPFSGFSGRMLGAFNCRKQYFGFDINEDHVKESNEIIDYKVIHDMCSVEVKDLISTTPKDYTYLKGTSLFTCPPYGGKEHWNEKNDEVEKSCDEWIDLCIEKYKVEKYLFVVDKTEKYQDKIVERIENKSHLGTSIEYVILI